MTTPTTLLGLLKAVGSDNARDYIKTALAAALDKIDATGHTGGTDGKQISVPALDLTTWGPLARIQGLIVGNQGAVTDNGGGVLTLSQVYVFNPAAGSWFTVADGAYTLGTDGALVCDLPPTSTRGSTVTPTVLVWSDADRAYDGKDRLVLAMRVGSGPIVTRLGTPAASPWRFNIQTFGAPAANLNVASIPAGFSAIEIVGQLRSDYAGGAFDEIGLRFNGDATAGHYNGGYVYGVTGSSTPSFAGVSNVGASRVGRCACVGSISTAFATLRLTIPSYANAAYAKGVSGYGSSGEYPTAGNVAIPFQCAGQWNQIGAITQVQLFPINGANWLAGSMWTVTLVP